NLADAPADEIEGFEKLVEELREALPEGGGELKPVLDELARGAAKTLNTAGPGYLAYIPGGGLYTAAIAEFLAQGINRYVGLWEFAPGLVQIEVNVIRWLCDLFDFPQEARGILTTGGSMANFSAIVSARKALLDEDFLDGTIYVSEQVHASVTKSAMLAGFASRNIRKVATTADLHVDPGALAAAIRDDRAAGRRPFLLVASAGTTNTGAVDAIGELASLAEREGLWLHVDGAYGGFFQLTARGRERFAGIERADSITLDPHKGMFLPYGTGCLIVRDGAKLRAAHHASADYLQDLAGEELLPNFTEYSPELSREFRGLRVWLPLKLHGVSTFREALDEKLDLARYLYERLLEVPGLELPWEPELTVVAFRGKDDASSKGILERINASKRVFMSSTTLQDRFTIRAAILSHRTYRERVEEAAEIVEKAAGA
ncbi:MAG: aminotransferase class V-fold PLP-dependent enzyme, partial [Actinomycetota bacterium]